MTGERMRLILVLSIAGLYLFLLSVMLTVLVLRAQH
jgi:hypothetical protein